ncbi:flagellar hook-length control protein FliK [Ferribacterium limneticum]|uniref:flagellar hook-length control protein FliK n=1 Tax=Ferribacterium limneticum TaxID=76259 RepID=UPI001CF8E6CF|nr:flagellar hook-length control protein FliK [Ferribacterium limneticum]UCV23775.1 flagellar hook-length control protein FliK [Ferribacterium limneticum]
MSIPAVSSLIAAIAGKAASPGLGGILTENGLPLDFAALLAEQIPSSGQATPALLAAENITAAQQPDTELLSEIIAQTSLAKDKTILPVDDKPLPSLPVTEGSAEEVLAALSTSPSLPATTITEPESKKENSNKERKLAADSAIIPTDPGVAAQYVVPMATPPVQNRLPENVDSDKTDPAPHMAKAEGIDTSGKEDRPALPEQRGSLLSGNTPTAPAPAATLAAQNPELRTPPRSDTANAAILAGDSNPGNSSSTPAFATAMAATGAANGTAAPTQQTPPPAITSTLNSPNWTHDFGSRVVWLTKNDQQVAQININPPQLGPIQITLSINGDQTTAAFASPHPEVRQAIQDSLPQLREMFANAGISLGQANVGSQLPSQNRETPFQFGNEARTSGENAILSPDSHASSNPAGIPIQRGRGLVDLFA